MQGLTTGRKNTDPTLGKLQRGSGSESPSTLRFSIGKKKDAWRDTVDMTTPRSMVIQNIEESGPNPQCLMQKDVTALSTRERVIKELFTTELSYCKSLQQIVKVSWLDSGSFFRFLRSLTGCDSIVLSTQAVQAGAAGCGVWKH